MPVSKQKRDELEKRMHALNIREEDLVEKFIIASKPGGQKVNKTASCVYLKHLPSQIEIKCSKDRSQDINRYWARCELCARLEKKLFGIKTTKEKKNEKIRKQKKRRERKRKLSKNLSDNL